MDITGGRLQYMLERLNTSSTVNVETFGAVGDGVTDDTLAIQAALDLAHTSGGGLVQFTPGKTYAVSTFLVVYDYTTIYAYGATIKAIGNTGLLRNFLGTETFSLYGGHSNVQILGGRWDGNAFNGTTGSVTAETDVMNFVHATNITVRDVTIENTSTAHALEFNAIDGGRALNCRFLGFKDNTADSSRQFSEAVQIDISASGSSSIGAFDSTPSKNILVDGCYFGTSARTGKFGRGVGSHTLASGAYYYGIQIVNNRIEGTLQEGIRGYGWRRAIIANNVIDGTGYSGIALTHPDPASAGYSANSRNLSITGNTIERPGTDSGIRVKGYSGATCDQVAISGNSILGNAADTANGIHVEYCSRPVVTGNTVSSTGSTGIFNNFSDGGSISGNTVRSSATTGINITQSTGTTVSGNNVDGTTSDHCIVVVSSNDFLITGNRTNNAGTGAVSTDNKAGIRLSTGAADGMVTNNRIIKGTTIKGISLIDGISGSTIAFNDLTGNSWGNVNSTTSGTVAAFSVGTATASTDFGGTSPGSSFPGQNLPGT
jgi:parallel beta-helix repeat protein